MKRFCRNCSRKIIKGTRGQTLCDICLLKAYKGRSKIKPNASNSRSKRLSGQS